MAATNETSKVDKTSVCTNRTNCVAGLSFKRRSVTGPGESRAAGMGCEPTCGSGSRLQHVPLESVRFRICSAEFVLIPTTTYTDDTIEAGQTYYYVCTAVNTSDLESGFSNEVPHTVPAPVSVLVRSTVTAHGTSWM